MNSWHSKLFALFLALAMLSILAAPANAKWWHHHRHGRRGGHPTTHHKVPKH